MASHLTTDLGKKATISQGFFGYFPVLALSPTKASCMLSAFPALLTVFDKILLCCLRLVILYFQLPEQLGL